jgi:hypothetical protein
MKTFPHDICTTTTNHTAEENNERICATATRWAESKTITHGLDQQPLNVVEYSALLSQQVAKFFPHLLVSHQDYRNRNSNAPNTSDNKKKNSNHAITPAGSNSSSSKPSTTAENAKKKRPKFLVAVAAEPFTIRPAALVVVQDAPHQASIITQRVLDRLEQFYKVEHPEIEESHGWNHVMAVYQHANRAIDSHRPPLSSHIAMEILVAALLHDVDDSKYFGKPTPPKRTGRPAPSLKVLANAYKTSYNNRNLLNGGAGSNCDPFARRVTEANAMVTQVEVMDLTTTTCSGGTGVPPLITILVDVKPNVLDAMVSCLNPKPLLRPDICYDPPPRVFLIW